MSDQTPSPWSRPEGGSTPPGFVPPSVPPQSNVPAQPNVPPLPGSTRPPPPGPPPPPGHVDGDGAGTPPTSPFAPRSLDGGQDRPAPHLISLVAAVGGLLLFASLLSFLTVEGIGDSRGSALAVSGLFTVLGAALALVSRSRRAVSAGVALSALAVIPLVSLALTDPDDLVSSFADLDRYRNTQMAILAILALFWLAAYFLSPGKGHGFYLGAGLIALWQLPMTWFNLSALNSLFDTFLSPSIDVTDDPFSTDPFSTVDTFDGGLSTLSGDAESLMLKLGATALVFGLAYLAVGAQRDAAGDARMGTPFFAVASLALITALGNLTAELGATWTSLLGLALGALAIWLGSRGGRRFTSWIGVASVVVSIAALLEEWLDAAPLATALALGFVGLLVAGGATWWGQISDDQPLS